MINVESFKIYKSVHTWTGIVAGLLLYICFVAGSVTMFTPDLDRWSLSQQNTLPAIKKSDYDTLIQQTLERFPAARKQLTVHLPNAYPQGAPVEWHVEDPETHTTVYWQASLDTDLQLIAQTSTHANVGTFIDNLHRTGGIPGEFGHDAFGTQVMGVIAGIYFVALVSGLIIFLPNWFKDLFSFRQTQNKKRYWLDIHNVLSLSALPFHLIIALTTFVFAFHDPIYDSMRGWIYKDQPMFSGAPASELSYKNSGVASIDSFEQSLKALQPDYELAELTFFRIEGRAPLVRTGGYMDGEITRGAEYVYANGNPFSGVVDYTDMLPSQMNFYSKVVSSLFTLHFGSFGGEPVRWIYFLLGILGSLVFLTGNILWIETRQKKAKQNAQDVKHKKSTLIMSKLTCGVATGTLLGIAAVIVTSKFLQSSQVTFWQTVIYHSCFFGSVAWTFFRPAIIAATDILLVLAITLTGFIAALLIYAPETLNTMSSTYAYTSVGVALTLWLRYKLKSKSKPMNITGSIWATWAHASQGSQCHVWIGIRRRKYVPSKT